MIEVTLLVVIALLVAIVISGAVLVFKTTSDAISKLDRAHERTTEYTSELLDRLMAMDFGEFKSYRLAEAWPQGEEENEAEPEEEILGGVPGALYALEGGEE